MRAAPVGFLTLLFVACAPVPPPAVEPPMVATASAAATTSVAPPSDAPPAVASDQPVAPAPRPPHEDEPVITKGHIIVPESKCSGRNLALGAILQACGCHGARALGNHRDPVCPGDPQSQSEPIPGLVVSVKAVETQVKSGAKLRVNVVFANRTEAALPLHFIQDHPLELVFLGAEGQPIPNEGKDTCPAMVREAQLAGVTLGPGGEVSTEISLRASKRKHRPGKDACGTMDGSGLPPGRYQIAIADSPLYGTGQARTGAIEVVDR